jgi:Ca2+/Na+ antiporter
MFNQRKEIRDRMSVKDKIYIDVFGAIIFLGFFGILFLYAFYFKPTVGTLLLLLISTALYIFVCSKLSKRLTDKFEESIKKTEIKPDKDLLYLLSRRIDGEQEDCSMNINRTVEKAQNWIEKYGRDWEDEKDGVDRDYFFVVMSVIVDPIEEHQPIDELYFFDKHGVKMKNQPF